METQQRGIQEPVETMLAKLRREEKEEHDTPKPAPAPQVEERNFTFDRGERFNLKGVAFEVDMAEGDELLLKVIGAAVEPEMRIDEALDKALLRVAQLQAMQARVNSKEQRKAEQAGRTSRGRRRAKLAKRARRAGR